RWPHVVAAAVDWPRFLAVTQARRSKPLLAPLQAEARTAPVTAGPSPLVARLRGLGAEQRRAALTSHGRGVAAGVLGMEPGALAPSQGFFQAGMDSIMAVELRRRLEADLGVPLPATLAMDRPNVEAAVSYLLGEVLDLEREGPAAPASSART